MTAEERRLKRNEYQRAWAKAHPDKVNAYHRRYRAAKGEEYRAKHREELRKWRAANPERNREMQRVWWAAHPEKVREKITKDKERRRVNPERDRARSAARRAAIRTGEDVDIRAIAERDDWRCGICQGPVSESEMSLDHITPLSHGGVHSSANVQLAHRKCNIARGARPLALLQEKS